MESNISKLTIESKNQGGQGGQGGQVWPPWFLLSIVNFEMLLSKLTIESKNQGGQGGQVWCMVLFTRKNSMDAVWHWCTPY